MTKEEYSRIISTVRRLHDTWFQTEQYRSSSSAVISLPKLSERDLLIAKRVIQNLVAFISFPVGSQFNNQQFRKDIEPYLTWDDFDEPEI